MESSSKETPYLFICIFIKQKCALGYCASTYNHPLNRYYSKALWSLSNLDKIPIISMQYEKEIDVLVCLRLNCFASIPLSFFTSRNYVGSGAENLISEVMSMGHC